MVTPVRGVGLRERVQKQRHHHPQRAHGDAVVLKKVGVSYRSFAVLVEDRDVLTTRLAGQKVYAREAEQVPHRVRLVEKHQNFDSRNANRVVYKHYEQQFGGLEILVSRVQHERQRRENGEANDDHDEHDVDKPVDIVIEYFRAVRVE